MCWPQGGAGPYADAWAPGRAADGASPSCPASPLHGPCPPSCVPRGRKPGREHGVLGPAGGQKTQPQPSSPCSAGVQPLLCAGPPGPPHPSPAQQPWGALEEWGASLPPAACSGHLPTHRKHGPWAPAAAAAPRGPHPCCCADPRPGGSSCWLLAAPAHGLALSGRGRSRQAPGDGDARWQRWGAAGGDGDFRRLVCCSGDNGRRPGSWRAAQGPPGHSARVRTHTYIAHLPTCTRTHACPCLAALTSAPRLSAGPRMQGWGALAAGPRGLDLRNLRPLIGSGTRAFPGTMGRRL